MADFELKKCPRCGGTKVDLQTGHATDEAGEVQYIDYDPICVECEYPLGDDWYGEKEEDVAKEQNVNEH